MESTGTYRFCWIVVGLLLLLGQASCSKPQKKNVIPNKVPLTSVTGVVLVDGMPTPGVTVGCVAFSDLAKKRDQFVSKGFIAVTDREGKFSMSTYARGDGLPHGEFGMGFLLIEQKPSGEKDLLGGRYPIGRKFPLIKPFMKIKVEPDQELDLGEIELTSAK